MQCVDFRSWILTPGFYAQFRSSWETGAMVHHIIGLRSCLEFKMTHSQNQENNNEYPPAHCRASDVVWRDLWDIYRTYRCQDYSRFLQPAKLKRKLQISEQWKRPGCLLLSMQWQRAALCTCSKTANSSSGFSLLWILHFPVWSRVMLSFPGNSTKVFDKNKEIYVVAPMPNPGEHSRRRAPLWFWLGSCPPPGRSAWGAAVCSRSSCAAGPGRLRSPATPETVRKSWKFLIYSCFFFVLFHLCFAFSIFLFFSEREKIKRGESSHQEFFHRNCAKNALSQRNFCRATRKFVQKFISAMGWKRRTRNFLRLCTWVHLSKPIHAAECSKCLRSSSSDVTLPSANNDFKREMALSCKSKFRFRSRKLQQLKIQVLREMKTIRATCAERNTLTFTASSMAWSRASWVWDPTHPINAMVSTLQT